MTKTHTISSERYWNLAIIMVMAFVALLPFSGTAYADNDSNSKAGTGVEVNIGSNGSALVRGAKVTSVSGSTIGADTSYGSSILNWLVKTDSTTKFTANKGSTTGLAHIAVGDLVSFQGSLDQAVSGLTVNAKAVKDWTQVESNKNISGIVTSISTTLGSFLLSHDNATTTVQTNSATIFKLSNGTAASFADLFLNAKVKVIGLFNASSSILTATSVDIGTTTNKNDHGGDLRDWFRGNFWLNFWHR